MATTLNQLSHLVTVCGIALLPVCFIGQIIAASSARPGDNHFIQRTCRVVFERTLCVVVTVPLLAFFVALLSLWIAALR